MPRAGSRVPMTERIKSRVDIDANGCWLWRGQRFASGYARIEVREGIGRSARRFRMGHRVSYEAFRAPVGEGLQLDHLCRVKRCVNPDHLEPVTAQENTLRGYSPTAANARKTQCTKGHPYDEGNTRHKGGRQPQRRCRECDRQYEALRWRRRSVAKPGSGDPA